MLNLDKLIIEFDKGLRTLFASEQTQRPVPGGDLEQVQLNATEKRLAAALMRVNHSGEVCAHALYQGQALSARNPAARTALEQSAQEETEHLNWCERRICELGSHQSYLNPLWYTGSLAIGVLSGVLGDKWNLGFLAETERQVERHPDSHLGRLPQHDAKSRAIVEQMKSDEVQHATTVLEHGGAELPASVKNLMWLTSRMMTKTAFWV